jgi:peroxiredoxin
MRLKAPSPSIDFSTQDIHGTPFRLSDYLGQRVVLSFFRDAACPFCNFRVYELTHQYKAWKEKGLKVIVVFSDTRKKVAAHVAKHPRPFVMLADPSLALYSRYGVEQSALALFKALVFRLPRIIKGILTGGRPSNNPHIKLVPADFLIDEHGLIQEIWYGRDTSDHIPLERITACIEAGKRTKR